MKRKKLVKATVSLEKAQLDWLRKNKYDLSQLTRSYLREFIASIERTKSGIAVPAWVRAADSSTIRERLSKNPKLKHLAGGD